METSSATAAAHRVARLLDSAFRVPGTRFRFGLDPVLGLVPGLGDAVAGSFGFYLLVVALRAGAPPIILLHMFANIGVDLLTGAIPLIGDLLDAGYKANLRNLDLLERYLRQPETTTRRSLILFVFLSLLLLAMVGGLIWLTVSALRTLLSGIA